MIVSAPVSIEDSAVAHRLGTPKNKSSTSQSKATLSSSFDSALPLFPDLAMPAAGSAKYEVFMSGGGGGRVREIKVNSDRYTFLRFFFYLFLQRLFCHLIIVSYNLCQGAVNALHEAVDSKNPGKLPRLVFPGNQQQQQQQHMQTQEVDSEIAFPDSFTVAAMQGPLFV
jgi:hypothetical protein